MQGYRAPIEGFKTFVTKPYLWFGPLFWSLVTAAFLACLFFFAVTWTWPTGQINVAFAWGVLKSFGFGMLAVLVAWVFLFPFVLAGAFEGMIGKLFVERRLDVQTEGLVTSIKSAIFITWKTLLIRIVWGVVALIAVWFLHLLDSL